LISIYNLVLGLGLGLVNYGLGLGRGFDTYGRGLGGSGLDSITGYYMLVCVLYCFLALFFVRRGG